jgi:hypothetical protein
MKKLYVIFPFLLLLMYCGTQADKVDKPIKGEWDFQLKKAWETNQLGPHVTDKIRGIQVSKEGKVFMWEQKLLKVIVCNTRGEFLYDFGGKGEGPGEVMDQPASRLFLSDTHVILHESNTGRVHYFLHDGTFEKTLRIKIKQFSYALKTFIDNHRFLFFHSTNYPSKQKTVLGIYNIVTNDVKEIAKMPADRPLKAGNISLNNPDITPTTICTHLNGDKIFYGKNNKYIINMVDLKTNKTFAFGVKGRKGNEIREQTKKTLFEPYPINKTTIKELIEKCPDTTTFYRDILISKSGLIYVFVPNWEKRKSIEIDIFSPSGKYLYHSVIEIPAQYKFYSNLTFNGDELYFTGRDQSDEIKLVKYTITPPVL